MKLAIIIPAYNEEKRIGKTLETYSSFFEKLRKANKLDYETLIVINGTRDKTEDVVKKYGEKNSRIRHLNFKRGGKGFAIMEGFKESLKRENGLIGFVDADLATKPEHFYELVKNIGDFDAAIASRAMKDSVIQTSKLRRINSRGFNWIVRLLLFLPYRDTQCGAKVFKRKAIEKIVNSSIEAQWAFDVDLLYTLKKKGFSIIEVPTTWEEKSGGSIKMMTPLKMFSSIVRLRLLHSPFKFIVEFYDKLPERIKIHNF